MNMKIQRPCRLGWVEIAATVAMAGRGGNAPQGQAAPATVSTIPMAAGNVDMRPCLPAGIAAAARTAMARQRQATAPAAP